AWAVGVVGPRDRHAHAVLLGVGAAQVLGHALGPAVALVGLLGHVARALRLGRGDGAIARVHAGGAHDEKSADPGLARRLEDVGPDGDVVAEQGGGVDAVVAHAPDGGGHVQHDVLAFAGLEAGRGVGEFRLQEADVLPDRLQIALLDRARPVGDGDLDALSGLEEELHDVAADEAAPARDQHFLTIPITHAAKYYQFARSPRPPWNKTGSSFVYLGALTSQNHVLY